jgi:hypothetical protein
MAVNTYGSYKMVIYIAVLEEAWWVQEFWCANHTKIPYFDREIKYLDFVSGHLASVETEWPKQIQVTESIQVSLTPIWGGRVVNFFNYGFWILN